MMKTHVAIVGAGLSGLYAACYWNRPGQITWFSKVATGWAAASYRSIAQALIWAQHGFGRRFNLGFANCWHN